MGNIAGVWCSHQTVFVKSSPIQDDTHPKNNFNFFAVCKGVIVRGGKQRTRLFTGELVDWTSGSFLFFPSPGRKEVKACLEFR